MSEVQVGLMGKHPGYGDFLQAGLPQPLVNSMNGWFDATLPPLRDQLGDHWGPVWDAAHDLRFWIGRAVLGRTTVGVLRASRDRVGRRFPFVMLATGVAMPVPLGAGVDQAPWEALEKHMNKMEPVQGSAALLEGDLPEFEAEEDAALAEGSVLWAHHPLADLDALLTSADGPDAVRAQLSRSYWWSPGERTDEINRAAIWLGCQGLPDAQALGWLLGGVPGAAEEGV